MTINLFVIANVKQLRTDGSFSILLPFFRTYWGVGALNSAICNNFHSRVEFGTILEGLRNFGGGEVRTPNPPRYATASVAPDTLIYIFLKRTRCSPSKPRSPVITTNYSPSFVFIFLFVNLPLAPTVVAILRCCYSISFKIFSTVCTQKIELQVTAFQ